ncbi:MAG: thiol:disulfide interchange protein DsbA/DsbL [Dyella sp.]
MLKRLPFLCATLLVLAACSHNGDNAASVQPATPATAAVPAAPVSAPAAAASAPATAQSSAPAADSTAGASSTPSPASASTAGAATASTFAEDPTWVEGKNYFLIQPQQPTSHPGKIEVTEVFSYGCPACNAFHTTADKIAQQLPADAVMVYLPASFMAAENWPMLQRAYLTAQTLGVADKSHDAMYDAIWVSGELSAMDPRTGRPKPSDALPGLDAMAKFYAKYGIDAKTFEGVANSFAINTKMKRADELVKAYGVEGTPTMVIDGKYRFDVGSAGGYDQTVALTKYLVAKEAAGK